jgi:cysteine desulfurase
MPERIYLDHAATTPLAPEVREAMLPWLGAVGNPSSLHAEGRRQKAAIDAAREAVSEALGALFAEVVFTSSGTEAANAALVGAALAGDPGRRPRILLGAAEHHCVLHTAPVVERLGYRVETVAVDRHAQLDLEDLERRLGDDVLLVASLHANNEFGTLNDARRTADLAHRYRALYLCDAVQTFRAPGQAWSVDDLGADLLTVSAHKIYGPKGVGALYVRAGTKVKGLLLGGGQERELRAGTENVAGIVGFGEAARRPPADPAPIAAARDRFLARLEPHGFRRTVPPDVETLPGHAHGRFPGLSAETLLIVLDRLGVAASSGAACSSGSIEPSHVLLAAGYDEEEAKEGLRFTFGQDASLELAEEAADRVVQAAQTVRGAAGQR